MRVLRLRKKGHEALPEKRLKTREQTAALGGQIRQNVYLPLGMTLHALHELIAQMRVSPQDIRHLVNEAVKTSRIKPAYVLDKGQLLGRVLAERMRLPEVTRATQLICCRTAAETAAVVEKRRHAKPIELLTNRAAQYCERGQNGTAFGIFFILCWEIKCSACGLFF